MPRIDVLMTGRVFDIQRFSIHDGPGIRTTVFLKGCPLNCVWCHNPESICPEPVLSFAPDKCIGCGSCFRKCPNGAHRMEDGRHVLDRTACVACGACAAECHAKALELVGRDTTVAEVLDLVLRDVAFYEATDGGLTLSGGEPLLQIDFTAALLKAAKSVGLHCAVETCLFCDYERIERIRPYVDLFLCDWKETDPEKHRIFTGMPNEPIYGNLCRLSETGARIRLRCPIVPGCNDREDHFAGIASFSRRIRNLDGVELIPYHALGESKRKRFGMPATRYRP